MTPLETVLPLYGYWKPLATRQQILDFCNILLVITEQCIDDYYDRKYDPVYIKLRAFRESVLNEITAIGKLPL
jgi:hypothetical protein